VIDKLRREKGVPWGSIAVLARNVSRLSSLAGALRRAGVPITMYSAYDFALGSPTVKLSTLHSAKGLEFPVVLIAGLDAGTVPAIVTDEDPDTRAEAEGNERRLLYVGMTRAMQELFLLAAKVTPSPFLAELGSDVVDRATAA
jgi:superfamily I DNA/RNA helicase